MNVSVKDYNKLPRFNSICGNKPIITEKKEETIKKLKDMLDNDANKHLAIDIIKNLIEFKLARQSVRAWRVSGDETKQEECLSNIKDTLQDENIGIPYVDICQLVRSDNVLFKEAIPQVFKDFLIDIKTLYPAEFKQISAANYKFLVTNSIIVNNVSYKFSNKSKLLSIDDLKKIGEPSSDMLRRVYTKQVKLADGRNYSIALPESNTIGRVNFELGSDPKNNLLKFVNLVKTFMDDNLEVIGFHHPGWNNYNNLNNSSPKYPYLNQNQITVCFGEGTDIPVILLKLDQYLSENVTIKGNISPEIFGDDTRYEKSNFISSTTYE